MGEMVIAVLRPKPGCEDQLKDLARSHVPILRELGLATARAPVMMQNAEGVVLEVFEWVDGGVGTAHNHPEVLQLWERYQAVSDYVKLVDLPEANELFAMFTPFE